MLFNLSACLNCPLRCNCSYGGFTAVEDVSYGGDKIKATIQGFVNKHHFRHISFLLSIRLTTLGVVYFGHIYADGNVCEIVFQITR